MSGLGAPGDGDSGRLSPTSMELRELEARTGEQKEGDDATE